MFQLSARSPRAANVGGAVRRLPLLFALVLAALALTPSLATAADNPTQVQLSFEGCRLPAGETLPNSNGDFICDNADYTSGNLGKSWNELDLVPHRLTAESSDAKSYTVAITADNQDAGKTGYDVISAPVLNADLSSGTCSISSTPQMELIPGAGGVDVSIYRFITITQSAGSICVFDYYERLALGAAQFSGSSLHSNLLNHELGTAGVGARDISIPVKEILPQDLDKTMDATKGSTTSWNITKDSSPNDLNFNTCTSGTSSQAQGVTITVNWTKTTVAAGVVTITTNITLDNPAHRDITANVTDRIYEGAAQTTQVGSTYTSGATVVPAGSTVTLTNVQSVAVTPGVNSYNDVATATYTDLVTNVPVPGNTTATASATVQDVAGTPNDTATITDTEQITGNGLSFSIDSISLAGGTLTPGYTLGDKITGPIKWSKDVTEGGSVVFQKTVFVDGDLNTTGTLSDTATLTDKVGNVLTRNASTSITARACIQGKKFVDSNANGAFDQGEPGLAGVRVYVDLNNNSQFDVGEPSAVTDANGNYSISTATIDDGNYTLREVLPAGQVCSFPATCSYPIVVGPGPAVTGKDFGNYVPASITGLKYADNNNNGSQNLGEPGLGGFTFFVDLNNNSVLDPGEPSAVSAANGMFTITGIKPGGPYTVREVGKPGFTCTQPNPCSYQVTLTSGEAEGVGPFGNYSPGSISGLKYADNNNNGAQNTGEPGLAGFTFYVDVNNNSTFDVGEPSAVSAADGTWTITGVNPGTYTVREVSKPGFTCTQPSPCTYQVTVSANQTESGKVFGNYSPATVSGLKYSDDNNNGAQNTGETGLAGFTFYVDLNNNSTLDTGEPSAVSAANGTFTITGIDPGGPYTVREVGKPGFTCTQPSPCSYQVTLAPNQTETGKVFGNFAPASVSGLKYSDDNNNGAQNTGEAGLAGFTFYVDLNNNSALDTGEPSAVSAANGTWTITGIKAGTYTVREVGKPNYTCTQPSPCSYQVTLAANQADTGKVFGNFAPATISGLKYADNNNNGAQNTGETGLAGFTFYVDLNNNSALDTGEPSAVSGADGTWTITGIKAGTYTVREVGKPNYTCTQPSPCSYQVTLAANQADTGKVFGNFAPATISGLKYADNNDNGAQNTGETGLAGFTFYVDLNNNSALDAGEPSAVSGADGTWTITGIKAGTYTVREVNKPGFTCTQPSPCSYQVTVAADQTQSGRIFGNYSPATVSGLKYSDDNNNGAQDTGEAGLAGFTFFVDVNNNSALDAGEPSAVSAADGTWTITGINPGSYSVREVGKPGYNCTQPSPCVYQVTLAPNGTATGRVFGNFLVPPPPTVAGVDVVSPPVPPVVRPPAPVIKGTAALRGPSACVSRVFVAAVTGRSITRVRFYMKNKLVATRTKRDALGRFVYRINPNTMSFAAHKIIARVDFKASSKTAPKKLSFVVARCARAPQPKFTG